MNKYISVLFIKSTYICTFNLKKHNFFLSNSNIFFFFQSGYILIFINFLIKHKVNMFSLAKVPHYLIFTLKKYHFFTKQKTCLVCIQKKLIFNKENITLIKHKYHVLSEVSKVLYIYN